MALAAFAAMPTPPTPAIPPPPKLLDRLRAAIRLRHFSRRTGYRRRPDRGAEWQGWQGSADDATAESAAIREGARRRETIGTSLSFSGP